MVNDINKNTSVNNEVATLNKATVDAILAVAKTDPNLNNERLGFIKQFITLPMSKFAIVLSVPKSLHNYFEKKQYVETCSAHTPPEASVHSDTHILIPDIALNAPIIFSEWSTRTRNILKINEMRYIGDIATKTEQWWRMRRGVGDAVIREMQTKLRHHNLHLGWICHEGIPKPNIQPQTQNLSVPYSSGDDDKILPSDTSENICSDRIRKRCLSDFYRDAETADSSLVTLSDEGVGLAAYPYPGGCNLYYIGWDRINSKGKLLRWILHLTDKTWFTQDMCRELIGAAISHFKWEMPQL